MGNMKKSVVAIAVSMAMFSGIAAAEKVTVKAMGTAFEPDVVFLKPGDSVSFTNMAGHDVASVEGMIPEGAKSFSGAMGEEVSVTFEKEGAYVYLCHPHVSLGMVGGIVVGENPANLEALKSHPETQKQPMLARAVKKIGKALEKKGGAAAAPAAPAAPAAAPEAPAAK